MTIELRGRDDRGHVVVKQTYENWLVAARIILDQPFEEVEEVDWDLVDKALENREQWLHEVTF